MRIGELAHATGISVESVRHYERIGLLPSPERSDAGQRRYGPQHLQRLAFVRHCRSLDIALADIARLLEFVDRPEADCDDIDRLVDTQLSRVRTRIEALRRLEAQLETLRGCCGTPRRADQCGILRELFDAAHGEAGADDGSLSPL
tara:strand:+ start:898 stop:1335 length:438 start_codon:yes stop_codon:yes gene_type:complete